MKKILFSIIALFLIQTSFGQKDFYKNYPFTKADSLRGSLSPERICYDVTFYDLNVAVDIENRFIKGYVDIFFDVEKDFTTLQIDLYKNMKISRITCYSKTLTFKRLYDAVFVYFPEKMERGTSASIRVFYEGYPREAPNPPWDGGFVWKKDEMGSPWIGVACEGDGASLWWPNKDHLYDEPDSMAINVAVPDGLMCVSNGNLRSTKQLNNGYTRFDWFVSYPINNYDVTVNIANYAHFSDTYVAEDGDSLDLDYYVLTYNLERAKKHFRQVQKVLSCFERYVGKYPFWNDGLALVETPYLGMEHQSAVAYGNKYMRGYLGGMIPRDMDWDFIIVHELGHEWFGNSLSCTDPAEMWLHESFTTYMESLYVECAYGQEDAIRYISNQRTFIQNREPILGPKNVNWDNWASSDYYFKGAWVLHTLRHAINDDAKWWQLLRDFYDYYALSSVTTTDFIDFVNAHTGRDWSRFFEQYLEYPGIPKLLYQVEEEGDNCRVFYKWEADVEGFDMPMLIGVKGDYQRIFPLTSEVKEIVIKNTIKSELEVPTDLFYVHKKQVNLVEKN